MIDERLESLLWEEIDGSLSADDRRSLEERLAADGEARAARQRLAAFNARLSSLEVVEPPAELSTSIRRALAARVSVARPAARWGGLFAPRGAFRFGWLAAGIAIGALLALLAGRGFGPKGLIAPEELYGTAALRPDETLELELGAGAGSIGVRRDGRRLTLTLRAVEPLELVVARPAGGLRLERISESAPLRELTATDERIEVATRLQGSGKIELWIDELGGQPAVLTVTSEGGGRIERQIELD